MLTIKRGNKIGKYSEKTHGKLDEIIRKYDPGLDPKTMVSLFVPVNATVICTSEGVYNPNINPSNVMFMIAPGKNDEMAIYMGQKPNPFGTDKAYLLKPNPKSIRANSGTISMNEKGTDVEYGKKTSLPVAIINTTDGISITHEPENMLYATVLHGRTQPVVF